LFAGLNAQVLGISVDHIPCLKAWANSLGGISYPLLSDFWPHGRVSECYDVLRSDGTSERAIFVIDREGIIQYIDVHDIDSQPSNMELREVLRRIDPEAAEQAPEEEDFDLPLAHGGIVMYCTPWCSDCKQAREWLIANKLPFTEVDISRNLKAAAQVRSWADGHETTPTFEINGTIVVEFQREKLAELLLK
jgi:glutaredoxin